MKSTWFIRLPNQATDVAKLQKLCGLDDISKMSSKCPKWVCSKQFVRGMGPLTSHPNPLPSQTQQVDKTSRVAVSRKRKTSAPACVTMETAAKSPRLGLGVAGEPHQPQPSPEQASTPLSSEEDPCPLDLSTATASSAAAVTQVSAAVQTTTDIDKLKLRCELVILRNENRKLMLEVEKLNFLLQKPKKTGIPRRQGVLSQKLAPNHAYLVPLLPGNVSNQALLPTTVQQLQSASAATNVKQSTPPMNHLPTMQLKQKLAQKIKQQAERRNEKTSTQSLAQDCLQQYKAVKQVIVKKENQCE